ncbi:hypothetical protein HYV30_00420 [Candidatus Kaiserbacteria bacterium]|nr:hypothetical protein [Candidatus Kaiserbacteria bacterium]
MSVLYQFVGKLTEQIVNPILLLLTAVAFVIFLWGAYEFVANAGDGKKREEGRQAIFWGIIGLVIIFGAYGILNVALRTFNIQEVVAPR